MLQTMSVSQCQSLYSNPVCSQIATYAVGTGALCLVVFRALSGIPFGAIWEFTLAAPQFHVDFRHVILGTQPSSKYQPV